MLLFVHTVLILSICNFLLFINLCNKLLISGRIFEEFSKRIGGDFIYFFWKAFQGCPQNTVGSNDQATIMLHGWQMIYSFTVL